MAKLVHLFLIALIVGAFVIPEQADAFIFKKLLKKALFAKKALLAPKLLLAKKALPMLAKKALPLALKAKKLVPLAVGAKLLAAKKIGAKVVLAKKFVVPKLAVASHSFKPISYSAPLPTYNTWTRASYAMPSYSAVSGPAQYIAPAMTQVTKTFQQGVKA